MGNAVQECEELQKTIKILQSELEKLQNELNAQTRANSASSPDSITSQDASHSLSLTSTSWNYGNTTTLGKNGLEIDNKSTRKVSNFAVHIFTDYLLYLLIYQELIYNISYSKWVVGQFLYLLNIMEKHHLLKFYMN